LVEATFLSYTYYSDMGFFDFSHVPGCGNDDPPDPTDKLPAPDLADADGAAATEPEPADPFEGVDSVFEGWD
jgi:hypothetical protein